MSDIPEFRKGRPLQTGLEAPRTINHSVTDHFQKRWETLTLPNPWIYAPSQLLDMLKYARVDMVTAKKLCENIELAPSMILVVN